MYLEDKEWLINYTSFQVGLVALFIAVIIITVVMFSLKIQRRKAYWVYAIVLAVGITAGLVGLALCFEAGWNYDVRVRDDPSGAPYRPSSVVGLGTVGIFLMFFSIMIFIILMIFEKTGKTSFLKGFIKIIPNKSSKIK